MKIICPGCKTTYRLPDTNYHKLREIKKVRCTLCKSLFYIKEKGKIKIKEGDNRFKHITFLHSYLEKREGVDRRKNTERRRIIDKEKLDYPPPSYDFIPIFNEEGISICFKGPGRRGGGDRRAGIDRRSQDTSH